MADSDDDYNVNEEDQAVWQDYIGDVQSTDEEEESFEILLEKEDAVPLQADDSSSHLVPVSHPSSSEASVKKGRNVSEVQLDRRTEEKLRKGKMRIERRLDLHGLNKAQAHEKLNIFIENCYQNDMRCVLVITGKGKSKSGSNNWLTPSNGVLKENAPLWLSSGSLKNIVLKYITAQPKDGGGGAIYVYLRRNR